MSVEFEMTTDINNPRDAVLGVDAYGNEAVVDMQANGGYGAGATFTGDQMRQLRRFLEYCYPASEDPPHGPDPWVRTSKVRWDPPPDTKTPEQADAMWAKIVGGAPTETHTIRFVDPDEDIR